MDTTRDMELSGWGRFPRQSCRVAWADRPAELAACLETDGPFIPRGLGRGYGDCALGQRVLLAGGRNLFESFDPASGELVCQAGASLAEIVAVFLPRGFFPAVTPGTKFVTVGGAAASDVHGKNHHAAGCFSSCLNWLELLAPGRGVTRTSRTEHPELFRATCGGMGLTGPILRASLNLRRVPSAMIDERVIPAPSLDHALELFEAHAGAEYSVAWVDALTRGPALGRSVLMVGGHAESGGLATRRAAGPTIPVDLPGFVLSRGAVAAFNEIFYRLAGRPRRHRRHLEGFFYPLDAIGEWHRLYGRSGFVQHQCVIPKAAGRAGLAAVLERAASFGGGSFLTVLKLFGPANDNPLSFPLEGYTLALDFRVRPGLFAFLEELDRVVLDHGGRLYLTKDARMSPATFRAGYPRLEEFRAVRRAWGLTDRLASRQSLRLGI